ncbi:MAG: indole-3-glycerol phosphate synthase TrpC [Deltaproteobacteria bacterium]|nr:indole-3-glycerol phosphate synthase TrpC [Deltaproteobacteria bacterium]
MILDDIVAKVRGRLAERKTLTPLPVLQRQAEAQPGCLDFAGAIAGREKKTIRVIAEVKKASPSKGVIRENFDPVGIARDYEQSGAAAVSVLTEEDFFQGRPDFLSSIRKAVSVPLLRKDFIIDPYQVREARALGADAFLLIVALLDKQKLEELILLGREIGMQALVEVHSGEELDRALDTSAGIIGINNRDLATFATDLETTFRLRERIGADRIVVSESGIREAADLVRLQKAGVDAVLVGETLMRAPRPGEQLQALLPKGPAA